MNLQPLVEMSLLFNEISGADTEISHKALQTQAKFVSDEADELRDACQLFNDTGQREGEIIKEALDVIVTAVGVLQKMQNRGYDIDAAAKEVGLNNLSKYPKDDTIVKQSLNLYGDKQVICFASYIPQYDCWTIRDAEGKVRKPYGYVSVDSDSFIKTKPTAKE